MESSPEIYLQNVIFRLSQRFALLRGQAYQFTYIAYELLRIGRLNLDLETAELIIYAYKLVLNTGHDFKTSQIETYAHPKDLEGGNFKLDLPKELVVAFAETIDSKTRHHRTIVLNLLVHLMTYDRPIPIEHSECGQLLYGITLYEILFPQFIPVEYAKIDLSPDFFDDDHFLE